MGPIGHTVISSAVAGGTWAITGSPAAAGVALGVGVLMDVDHLYDYYQRYVKGKKDRVYVLFHAWEYPMIMSFISLVFYHPFLLAVILGHLAHVTTDHVWNRLTPFAYSITYRAIKGFDSRHIAPQHHVMDSYRSLPRLLPLGHRVEPWFQRKIAPWFLASIDRTSANEAVPTSSDDCGSDSATRFL
ncbi:hypothetical protein MGWOODY_Clf586 [hydrothermal vent metagenome]|uniref:Uncharacterized protein n=1 Tax=hydrothermal vent metagenome TaxID=652676 RepID=A0A160VBS3_9ZZZZ